MKQSLKEVIFIILIVVLYIIVITVSTSPKINIHGDNSILVILLVIILCTASLFIYYNYVLKKKEPFTFEVTTGKLCRGGPYMWGNPNDENNKFKPCWDMLETPKGQHELSRYNCGPFYQGMPGRNFQYTPLSDSKWQNARCKNNKELDIRDNGIY
jgi:hypothetical protein